MSKGMVSFLAGFGGGYLKSDRQRSQDERQEKLDAQNTKLFDANMENINDQRLARQEEKDFKAANIAAQSAGKPDAGFQVTDAAGSNAFTKDADASAMLGDMASVKNAGVRENDATRVSTGRTGSTMQGAVAGNQVFADPIEAQAFSKTQSMSDYAKMQARKDVADQFGKMDLSDDIRGKLSKLESEGAFKAFSLAQSGDLEGAERVYQSTGSGRLPEGAKFKSIDVEDPATKIKRQVISVMGADGKPIVADLDQALRAYLSPETQYTMNKGDRQFTLDERKTTVAEKNAAINERKLDGMMAGMIGGRRSVGGGGGGGRSGNGGQSQSEFNPYAGFNMEHANTAATKLVDEAIAASQTPVSPQERATRISQAAFALRDSHAQQNGNRYIAASVGRAFAEAGESPKEYADAYKKAMALGFDQDALAAMGHKPPAGLEPKKEEVPKPKPTSGNVMQSMFPGGRKALLVAKKNQGKITPQEDAELTSLGGVPTPGGEWWRGKASDAAY